VRVRVEKRNRVRLCIFIGSTLYGGSESEKKSDG